MNWSCQFLGSYRMASYIEVGAYEAKRHLSDFLRQAKAGAVFRITQHGEHVADLIPPGAMEKRIASHAAEQMQDFMRRHQAVSNADIKALIGEGRD
jgi:prevent-host-death family protein